MTPVFGHEAADEGGPPERAKAVAVVYGGNAIEQRVDEDRPVVVTDDHVMDVKVARDPRRMGGKDGVDVTLPASPNAISPTAASLRPPSDR